MNKILTGLLLCFCCQFSHAVQVILSASNVIGSSLSFSTRPASKIFDEQVGTVTDLSTAFWASADYFSGFVYITIDLGQAYSLSSFDVFNTSAAPWGDRGTGSFEIWASNSVTQSGANNFVLSGASVLIGTGSLSAVAVGATPPAFHVLANDANPYRYLKFVPLTIASVNRAPSASSFALSELRVFASAVPEPSITTMLCGGVLLIFGFAIRTRGRRQLEFGDWAEI